MGTSDTTVPADGHQPLPIRQGDTTALVARAWLAGSCLHTDPVEALTVAPSLVRVARGIILEAHTKPLMSIALRGSGARSTGTKVSSGALLWPSALGLPDSGHIGGAPGHLDENCNVTSWRVGQEAGWSHETHGCADSLVFRAWLGPPSRSPSTRYWCASAWPTRVWQLQCRRPPGSNRGSSTTAVIPRWLPNFANFKGSLERGADAPAPRETLISASLSRVDVLTRAMVWVVCPPRADKEVHIEIDCLVAVESDR